MLVKDFLLFTVVMFAGGFVFMKLEAEQAEKALSPKKELGTLKRRIVEQTNLSMPYLDVLFRRLEKSMQENGVKEPYQWNYYESCFFVGSLLTTIGYGHIAPKTVGGRIFTIVFSLFGIPLTVMVVRNLSKKITCAVVKMVELLLKVKQRSKKEKPECKDLDTETSERKPRETEKEDTPPSDKEVRFACIILLLVLVVLFLLQSALFRVISEGWSMQESVYFWFITLTTIGFGDFVPYEGRKPGSMAATIIYYTGTFYLLLGLALIASLIQSVSFVLEGRFPAVSPAEPRIEDADPRVCNLVEE